MVGLFFLFFGVVSLVLVWKIDNILWMFNIIFNNICIDIKKVKVVFKLKVKF